MEIKPEDIRITMCNADHQTLQGNWGMLQTTGVSIFHIPTKIYVQCTKHCSQYRNKAEALVELEILIEKERGITIRGDI